MEKYGRDRQARDGAIIRRLRISCWITKFTHTDSEYVILTSYSTAKMVTRTRLNIAFIRTLYAGRKTFIKIYISIYLIRVPYSDLLS